MRARRVLAVVGALTALLGLTSLVTSPRPARAQPFVPSSDLQVLEHVPKRLPGAQREPSRDPLVAEQRARYALELYQRNADPRQLGRAEAELGAFWESSQAPVPIVVLRARLRATNHEFEAALGDLNAALAREPDDAQARFERATISTVLGRYDQARADCGRLAPLVSDLFGVGCRAAIRGLTGDARAAAADLAETLGRSPRRPAERGWAESLLGELWLRAGDTPRAEQSLKAALRSTPDDPYTLATLADLLLDAGRDAEVVSLLRRHESVDALLLRASIAEKRLALGKFQAHAVELGERFDAERLRGSEVHRREQARFELSVRGNAQRALELALANFAVQREPWDVRLVLEAALQSRQPRRADRACRFVAESGLEDPWVRRLVQKLAEAAH